jgi:hypothetical protein
VNEALHAADGLGPPVVLRQSRLPNSAMVAFGALAGVVGFASGADGDWVGWVILAGGPFAAGSYDLRRCGRFHPWRVPAIGGRSYLIAFEYPPNGLTVLG